MCRNGIISTSFTLFLLLDVLRKLSDLIAYPHIGCSSFTIVSLSKHVNSVIFTKFSTWAKALSSPLG